MNYSIYPLPTVVTVTITSLNIAPAGPTRIYIFNNDSLNPLVVSNAIPPGIPNTNISYVFQDGYNGSNISNLLSLSNDAEGAIIYGCTLRFRTTTGNADPTGLAGCNPYYAANNAYGQILPVNISTTANQTRGDDDVSIGVIDVPGRIGKWSQFSLIVPPGDNVTLTFYLTPVFKL